MTRNAGRFGNVNAPVIFTLPDKVWSPLKVPDNAPALIVGDVSVLLVSVSVVALPTSVSVASGKVIVLLVV